MNFKIIIKSSAEQDIREAKAWYEAKNIELGNSFIDSIDEVLGRISENPRLLALRYKEVRMGLTTRFPYAIHYVIETEAIIVLAVMHTRRKPRI